MLAVLAGFFKLTGHFEESEGRPFALDSFDAATIADWPLETTHQRVIANRHAFNDGAGTFKLA